MSSEAGTKTQETTVHIPALSGEEIHGMHIFGAPVTNTIFSTWVFMVALFTLIGVFYVSLRKNRFPRIKNTGLLLIQKLDDTIHDIAEDRHFTRKFFFLAAGFFIFIFLGNIFSLFLDWLILFMPSLVHYLRPINSDLNTTLALASIVIVLTQAIAIRSQGSFQYLKGYLFNFHGENTMEKFVHVFVGWLHLIGEFSKLMSLSFRLFGNILAGVVLISVLSYLTGQIEIFGIQIGGLLVVPFWLFELFVAFIQALIFFTLMNGYFKDAHSVE